MGVVQVQLPEHLKDIIDRKVAEGQVASEAAFLDEAIRRYADDLEAEDEIAAVAAAGIADIEAGRYITMATPEDDEALHRRAMERLHAGLVTDCG